MIELYQFALSGNCHKIRLMLSLLKLAYTGIAVNGGEKEHKSPAFLAGNPFGQVPVLKDGGDTVRDSGAILAYLARKYDSPGRWLPSEPMAMAQVIAWLATAAGEVARGPNLLRLHHKFGRKIDVEEAQQTSANLLRIMQERLAGNDWLASGHPTIADIAVYPYVALAPEGNIDLAPYPAVTAWMLRVRALDGYVGMDGMWQPEGAGAA